MNIQSAFNSGVTGFNDATQQAAESGSKIAQYTTSQPENIGQNTSKVEVATRVVEPVAITQELVNLKVAEHQALASAKVITTADEVLGSLIDTRV